MKFFERSVSFKRLNKVGFLAPLLTFIFFTSCEKKDRVSASTFQFGITPPASTLLKTETLTLSAHGGSATGSVDVYPSWSVSPDTMGSLNTSLGTTVVFTPSALGDVTVTATFDGLSATSQIAVVTYRPTSNTFDVYNDNGLPTGSDVSSDIFVNPSPSAGFSLTELSSGYTPEGVKYQRAASAVALDFWGITLDKAPSANRTRDLSSFSSGSLKFTLRLSRSLGATEGIQIEIDDLSLPPSSFTLTSGLNGFNRLNTDWQEISIPISSFAGVNLNQIKTPFAIVLPVTILQALTFDVDAIRWEK